MLENELREAKSYLERQTIELMHQNEQINMLNRRLSMSKENVSPNVMSLEKAEQLRARIEFLERQNGEYIEKIARLENELALQRNHTTVPYTNETNSDSHSAAGTYRKIQKLEIEKLKLVESNEFLSDKVNKLQMAYDGMRQQLDMNIAKYESLLNKVKDNEDDKHKYVVHAKKLDEQLKSLNANYVNLQKKVSTLEKENKELSDSLRTMENEKRNITEKWMKLSKKSKIDDNNKATMKALESELSERIREAEEFREKFVTAKTELQVLKESERAYKEIIETKAKELRDLQMKYDSTLKDKEALMKQNLDLIAQIERMQNDQMAYHKKIEQTFHNKDEIMMLKSTVPNLQQAIKKLELENSELNKKLLDSQQEIEKLYRRKSELEQGYEKVKNDLTYANTRWHLLVKDYEKLQEEKNKLLAERKREFELVESLEKEDVSTRPEEDKLIIYDPNKDYAFLNLRGEVEKIKSYDEQLWKNLGAALSQYVYSIKQRIQGNDMNAKYNRLLVKYYKLLETNKAAQKQPDFSQEIAQDPLAETFNTTTQNPPSNSTLRPETRVVGFANSHKRRVEEAYHHPHTSPALPNDSYHLNRTTLDQLEQQTPIKRNTEKGQLGFSQERRSSASNLKKYATTGSRETTQRQSIGSIPNTPVGEFTGQTALNKSEGITLEEELRNEILNTKALKENTSLEKLGLKKSMNPAESTLARSTTPLGNDRYRRILQNSLGKGAKVDEPRRRVSSSMREGARKSYHDLYLNKKDQLNTSAGNLNSSFHNTSNVLNHSYYK